MKTKELTIEEKAKAYDEVLERATELLEVGLKDTRDKRVVLSFFPELAESEDKKMIQYFKDLAPFDNAEELYEKYGFSHKDAIAWLEKKGEQKPAMIQWKGDNLKEVVDFTGVYKEGFEKWFHNSWEEYEKYVHEHNNIFKIFNEDGSHMEVPVGAWIIKAPDGYNTASRFAISPILTEISIESNFKFKKAIECIENYVNSFPHSQRPEIWQHINFLKSLKATTTKEWSKEDERNFDIIYGIIYNSCNAEDASKLNAWLLSLRPQKQWKPSLAQLNALSIVSKGNAPDDIEAIVSLYNDLKKLKG